MNQEKGYQLWFIAPHFSVITKSLFCLRKAQIFEAYINLWAQTIIFLVSLTQEPNKETKPTIYINLILEISHYLHEINRSFF